jgi:hypothetical protein
MQNFVRFGPRGESLRFPIDLWLESAVLKFLVNLGLLVSIGVFLHVGETLVDRFARIWPVVIYDLWFECATLHLHLFFYLVVYSRLLCLHTVVSQIFK